MTGGHTVTSAASIPDWDLTTISEAIRRREVASVEATRAYLDRIEQHDRVIGAYATVTAERALGEARAADEEIGRGARRGPLHGVPLAFKDLIAVAGVPMMAGSKVLEGNIPSEDADATERLTRAGAVLLGKLTMHEFAFGRSIKEGPLATGRNPWDVTRVTAGSSSGSGAAVAAGLCAGALGSDTGGSIRGPAAMCGIVGLKPTFGLVSRRGVVPMCWSLDHLGPMTRTVRDAAVLLQAIAGHDPRDAHTHTATPPNYTRDLEGGVRGLRLGLLRRFYVDWAGLHQDVRAAAESAFGELARQGASIQDVDAPTLDLAPAAWASFLAEMYEYHRETIRDRLAEYGEPTRTRLLMGGLVPAQDYLRAQRLRARLGREVAELFREVDALVFPGQAEPAVRFEDAPMAGLIAPTQRYTNPWNLLGLPAIAVPCGFSQDGLPVSIQIVGRPFDEPTVLRIARAYERATDWHTRRPDPAGWRLA